jgi:hypothetical protein
MDRLSTATAPRDGIYLKDSIHLMQSGSFGIKYSCVLIKGKVLKCRIEAMGVYDGNVTHISKGNALSEL